MIQGFYWDVPVDEATKNGTWWDNLASKAPDWADAGITAVWVPPPSKGHVGIKDMGYGIYDHYDLGNYDQKDTRETRFGSREELENMLLAMHNKGIAVYADVVLNHIFTDDEDIEANPAVKGYVFDEAIHDGRQRVPYPTNEIRWVIPDAQPGDYYVKIKGYHLPFSEPKGERGYDILVRWTGTVPNDPELEWEFEPNNGEGQFTNFLGSGRAMRGHIESPQDIDEYKITLNATHDIEIQLTARRENLGNTGRPWSWDHASQTNGYYPVEIWHHGENLADTTLEARTRTGISHPEHTGNGEENYNWSYVDFHPVDERDWLGGFGNQDSIITNTKLFGNNLNTFSARVQTRLKDWGKWLAEEIGFDGFRLDFVRGIQPDFVADWINNLPPEGQTEVHRWRVLVGQSPFPSQEMGR